MKAVPVVNRAGWLFRLQPPGRAGAGGDGPHPQAVPSVDAAFAYYRYTGGPGDLDTFRRRCEVVNAEGKPTGGRLGPAPPAGTTFFCPMQFPDAPPEDQPAPVVLSDGHYPRDLRRLAELHRPLFHFDGADPERPLDVADVFRQNGFRTAESLYPYEPDPQTGQPVEPPAFIRVPSGSDGSKVYVHIVVVRDGQFVRAFTQYYLFVRGASLALGDRGAGGDWQFAQVEFVRKVRGNAYIPFTVGCSARGLGHARFFDAAAAEWNRKERVYPPGGLSAQHADITPDGRPRLYIARGTRAIHFGAGAWRPVATGVDWALCRAAGRAAALAPQLFPARAAALAPDEIHEPRPFDPRPADLVFVLDGPPMGGGGGGAWPAFWIAWPGRFGADPRAPLGPKFRTPVSFAGADNDRGDLSWWANPHRFQARFLRADYEPRAVTPITLQVGPNGVDVIVRHRSRPGVLEARAFPTYAPASLSSDGPGYADLWRGVGELRFLRVRGPAGGHAPEVLRLLAPDQVRQPVAGEALFVVARGDFEAALAELRKHAAVALEVYLLGIPVAGPRGRDPVFPRLDDHLVAALRRLLDPLTGWTDAADALHQFAPPPGKPLPADMSLVERFLDVIARTVLFLPGAAYAELQKLRDPWNLGITVFVFGLLVGSQFTPVGWVCDLLLIPFIAIGVFAVVGDLFHFLELTARATTDADLDRAAHHLAEVVIAVGAAYFVGLILKFVPFRSVKSVPAEPAPGAPANPAGTLPRNVPLEPVPAAPAELTRVLPPPPGPGSTAGGPTLTPGWAEKYLPADSGAPRPFTFRGDRSGVSLPLERILKEGLKSKGAEMDLLAHTKNTLPGSGYVASSHNLRTAMDFAGKNGWVIMIRSPRGIDTVRVLGESHPHPAQMEVAFEREVPTEEIVSVGRLLKGEIVEFINNPNYRNPGESGPLPPLKPLFPDRLLSPAILSRFRKWTTEQLTDSLKLGEADSLKARPDGTILDGNHRIKVLRDRGVEVDSLLREIIPRDPVVDP